MDCTIHANNLAGSGYLEQDLIPDSCAVCCCSDLHPYHGREAGLQPGTVVGHEFVGIIEAAGSEVSACKPHGVWCISIANACPSSAVLHKLYYHPHSHSWPMHTAGCILLRAIDCKWLNMPAHALLHLAVLLLLLWLPLLLRQQQ